MMGKDFDVSMWRKSSQFFMLVRKHAEAVIADTYIWGKFKEHCRMAVGTDGRMHICLTDEHYIPSFLAYKMLEHETDCPGVITSDVWEWDRTKDEWPPAHPKEYTVDEVTPQQLQQLRTSESTGFVVPSSAQQNEAASEQHLASCAQYPAAMHASSQGLLSISELIFGRCFWQPHVGPLLLPKGCALLARKFLKDTAEVVLRLAHQPDTALLEQHSSAVQLTPAWNCSLNV